LVEGLFGIQPDALHDSLIIHPGYPSSWKFASLKTPDILFDFKRNGAEDNYVVKQSFRKLLKLKLIIEARKDLVESVTVNGVKAAYEVLHSAFNRPAIALNVPAMQVYDISIRWKGAPIIVVQPYYEISAGRKFIVKTPGATVVDLYDPQGSIDSASFEEGLVSGRGNHNLAGLAAFLKLKQGAFTWWQPINLRPVFSIMGFWHDSLYTGRASIEKGQTEKINLAGYFNDRLNNIFRNQYLSPRPKSPTLQLPTQGIGNWCYPLTTANIDDRGLRKQAEPNNEISYNEYISFSTPSDSLLKNVMFTSQWDNFPDSVIVPLTGNASEIYLLMAGSTNPMQSRVVNGMVVVQYLDKTADTLILKNPDNWWPIEQDYYVDGFAFNAGYELPVRLYLKEGKFATEAPAYTSIRGYSNRGIDGGAATVLTMSLNKAKELKSLSVHAVANDVVIGLMAATLVRP
jgi:hypothetical protein